MVDIVDVPRRSPKGYGWLPDVPDHRDLMFAPRITPRALPPRASVREQCPAVYDQLNLGSCTAQAIAAAIEVAMAKQSRTPQTPSRLFIYYFERKIIDTIEQDSGAMIRDGIKVVAKKGAPEEPLWPYATTRFAVLPPKSLRQHAKTGLVSAYRRLPRSLDAMRSCLAEGTPFVFGFSVYTSFESAEVGGSGVVELPGPDEQLLGGHAVLAVGYDDETVRFTVRNSWGGAWGDKGYFTMPYAYLLDEGLADDFWAIEAAADPTA